MQQSKLKGFKFWQQAGFTLIEVLISIVLLSFLMIGVYSLVDNSARTRENVLSEDQEFVSLISALQRMEEDFAQFYTPLFYSVRYTPSTAVKNGEEGKTSRDKYIATETFPSISKKGQLIPTLVNEDKNSLVFMTTANRRSYENAKESRYAWVKYTLMDMEKEPNAPGLKRLVRYFLPNNPYAPDFNFDDAKPATLLNNVKTLKFEFWDAERKNYVDSLRNLNSENALLRILKVTIEWVDLAGHEQTDERILRVQWPYFDTRKDDQEYTKALNESGSGGQTNPEDSDEQ